MLTYRPLTGSPTGGKPRSETYDIEVKNIPSGWRVRVKNTSVVSSKHPLVVQLDYDRAIGHVIILMEMRFTPCLSILESCTTKL